MYVYLQKTEFAYKASDFPYFSSFGPNIKPVSSICTSVHREGVDPSSMEGVLDLSDHISVRTLFSAEND